MKNPNYDINDINELLFRLGIFSKYTGFKYIQDALMLLKEDEDLVCVPTKLLYPQIAKKYNTSVSSVERNIRTIAEVFWKNDKELLQDISDTLIEKRPTAAQLLKILYEYLCKIC